MFNGGGGPKACSHALGFFNLIVYTGFGCVWEKVAACG